MKTINETHENEFCSSIPLFHHANCDLPARTPGRLALPVRHRLRLRRMPGGLGWRASLQWQAGRRERTCSSFLWVFSKNQRCIRSTETERIRKGCNNLGFFGLADDIVQALAFRINLFQVQNRRDFIVING